MIIISVERRKSEQILYCWWVWEGRKWKWHHYTLPRLRAGPQLGYLWDWVSLLTSALGTSPFHWGTQMVSALKALSKTAKWAQFIIFCLFLFLSGPLPTPMWEGLTWVIHSILGVLCLNILCFWSKMVALGSSLGDTSSRYMVVAGPWSNLKASSRSSDDAVPLLEEVLIPFTVFSFVSPGYTVHISCAWPCQLTM